MRAYGPGACSAATWGGCLPFAASQSDKGMPGLRLLLARVDSGGGPNLPAVERRAATLAQASLGALPALVGFGWPGTPSPAASHRHIATTKSGRRREWHAGRRRRHGVPYHRAPPPCRRAPPPRAIRVPHRRLFVGLGEQEEEQEAQERQQGQGHQGAGASGARSPPRAGGKRVHLPAAAGGSVQVRRRRWEGAHGGGAAAAAGQRERLPPRLAGTRHHHPCRGHRARRLR